MAAAPGGTDFRLHPSANTRTSKGRVSPVSAELREVRLEAQAALQHKEKLTQRQHSEVGNRILVAILKHF